VAGQKFVERIESSARFLATSTAQSARGYLDSPLETALLVLDQFADGKARDYAEISEATGLHDSTVRQIIRALDHGGYPLQFKYADFRSKIGRKPVSIQKKETTSKKRPSLSQKEALDAAEAKNKKGRKDASSD